MRRYLNILVFFAAIGCVTSTGSSGWAAERRLALVIGNSSYKAKPLATTVNDAALVAQTLQLAGFEVVGLRDLDQALMRQAFQDFSDQVRRAGSDAVAVVYFSGYGAQLGGENYLVPINTELPDTADLAARTLPLSEMTRALAALHPKATFVVVDASRPGPFLLPGQAGGLAWTEADPNMLIAFSAAPGTLARDTANGYGSYARALAEMIREGDLAPADLFHRVRLRVHELTKGGQIPWEASRIKAPFKFFTRTPAAPPRTDAPARTASFRLQPMRALGAQNAYMTALTRDTFDAYTDYLADFWQEPTIKRVRAVLAARREAITWRRTCQANEPASYWSYLERYPQGPHVADASRLLNRLGAASTVPVKFARLDYDLPPPTPDELEYIERPSLVLDDPANGFDPPPSTPAVFLEPMPQELLSAKPVASVTADGRALPIPNLPLPAYIRPSPEVGPDLSKDNQQAWALRPAVGVPTRLQSQINASSSSTQSTTDTRDLAKAALASPAEDDATQKKGKVVGSANQENMAETSSRSTSLSPATSALLDPGLPSRLKAGQPTEEVTETSYAGGPQPKTPVGPSWLKDNLSDRERLSSSSPFPVDSSMKASTPSMFASASSGLTLQTWQQQSPRSSLPIAHPTPRRTLRPFQSSTPGAVGTTASIARTSIGRTTNGEPSRRMNNSSASGRNEAKPPRKPTPLNPSNQTVRNAREPLVTVPSNPQ